MTSLQLSWLVGSAGAVLVFIVGSMMTFEVQVDQTRTGVSLLIAFAMILVLVIRVLMGPQ